MLLSEVTMSRVWVSRRWTTESCGGHASRKQASLSGSDTTRERTDLDEFPESVYAPAGVEHELLDLCEVVSERIGGVFGVFESLEAGLDDVDLVVCAAGEGVLELCALFFYALAEGREAVQARRRREVLCSAVLWVSSAAEVGEEARVRTSARAAAAVGAPAKAIPVSGERVGAVRAACRRASERESAGSPLRPSPSG